tara:strand:+ start:2698 stop:3654 length:957 start_codon:yes stop_codon:yes gene_type:complete
MKSIFLLGSATLAAGAGITIEVEKIAVDTSSDPEFGGCVANTVITTEEQCHAAALALRSIGQLDADTAVNHPNAPFPQVTTGGWSIMPKGCVVWLGNQIHWNEGSNAGTEASDNSVTDSICLVHDPETTKVATTLNDDGRVVGNACKPIQRIHSGAQCLAAAHTHGYTGTIHTYIDTTEYSVPGITSGLYTSCVDVVDASTWQYAAQPCADGFEGVDCDTTYPSSTQSYARQMCKFGRLLLDHTSVVIPPIPEGCFLWDNVLIYQDDTDDSTNYPAEYSHGICTSGKVWKSANELADASCEELSQEYRDDTCCTNCVA